MFFFLLFKPGYSVYNQATQYITVLLLFSQVRWWASQLKQHAPIGGFLIRKPDSQLDAYALVCKQAHSELKNYLIKCETGGFRLGNLRAQTFMGLIKLLGRKGKHNPLPVALLPGFYLNKIITIRKALRESKATS